MNKLLFHYERPFNDDIVLIANNHKDLEYYLKTNYDWYIEMKDSAVKIIEAHGYESEYATLTWIKHI